jgi:hypothetical protein
MVVMPRAAALLMLAAALSGLAHGDGGAVICSRHAGGLRITLFAAPAPLTTGSADLSVMVQRADGSAVLDARVALEISAEGKRLLVHLRRDAAANRLLYAAPVSFPSPGLWSVRTLVDGAGAQAALACALPVNPAHGRLEGVWWFVALVPAVLIIFALHQWLASRQRSDAGRGQL